METITQCSLIAEYMKEHGSITPIEAEKEPIGCRRLAARIADLRKAGVVITTIRRTYISKVTGRKSSFAEYRLGGEEC